MRLRALRWWDVADVVAIEAELFPGDAWTAESFWAELAIGAARAYLVAEDGAGRVVGYAGLSCPPHARGGDAEVMTVAVAPGQQGRGVGRQLLAALTEEAARRGAGRLLLEVRADNQAARALYESAGFGSLSVRTGYYRSADQGAPAGSVDALVLSRPLAGPVAAPAAVDSVPT